MTVTTLASLRALGMLAKVVEPAVVWLFRWCRARTSLIWIACRYRYTHLHSPRSASPGLGQCSSFTLRGFTDRGCSSDPMYGTDML
ncbi:hypothetical protein BV20DRAFT_208686 [Pilatotrama ljubarskyi]|nr:hypothetical protein BV20DRAFT_208686 [Pilatotrama ljubarskyi]